jgi:hypothetical protein
MSSASKALVGAHARYRLSDSLLAESEGWLSGIDDRLYPTISSTPASALTSPETAATSGMSASASGADEPYVFEGCEKRLVVNFFGDAEKGGDLRSLSRDSWTELLEHARCTILNDARSEEFVAYLLSESSLFVYKDKIIIKTCGTTTVLNMIPSLLRKCRALGLMPEFVSYSRANFMFPEKQPEMYRKFENEVAYLNRYFDGDATVLGPITGARWHVYTAGEILLEHAFDGKLSDTESPLPNLAEGALTTEPDLEPDLDCEAVKLKDANVHAAPSIELVMFELDRDAMQLFIRENLPAELTEIEECSARESAIVEYVLRESGVAALLPSDATIDAFQFEPCGFSLNGLRGHDYWTIHITPEEHGSFVSFECTNVEGKLDFFETLKKVVALFKPKRFGVCINSVDADDITSLSSKIRKFRDGFSLKNFSTHFSAPTALSSLTANFKAHSTLQLAVLGRGSRGALSVSAMKSLSEENDCYSPEKSFGVSERSLCQEISSLSLDVSTSDE